MTEDVAALLALVEKARQEVFALCRRKEWRMTIPVQPEDSDVVICDALDALEDALTASEAARQVAEQQERRDVVEMIDLRARAEQAEATCATLRQELSEYGMAFGRLADETSAQHAQSIRKLFDRLDAEREALRLLERTVRGMLRTADDATQEQINTFDIVARVADLKLKEIECATLQQELEQWNNDCAAWDLDNTELENEKTVLRQELDALRARPTLTEVEQRFVDEFRIGQARGGDSYQKKMILAIIDRLTASAGDEATCAALREERYALIHHLELDQRAYLDLVKRSDRWRVDLGNRCDDLDDLHARLTLTAREKKFVKLMQDYNATLDTGGEIRELLAIVTRLIEPG